MLHTTISIIAAMDEKRGIGKDNDLLFRIPEDMKRFRSITAGKPVIMGRRTFDSLHMPDGLPKRANVIITQNKNLKVQNCFVAHSLEEAIHIARETGETKEIFILGGGQIFKDAMEKNLVDRLYLTIVEGNYDADTFFPDYSAFTKVISEQSGESGGYKYRFLDLER